MESIRLGRGWAESHDYSLAGTSISLLDSLLAINIHYLIRFRVEPGV